MPSKHRQSLEDQLCCHSAGPRKRSLRLCRSSIAEKLALRQLGSSLAARAPVTDAGAGITDPGTFACCDSGFEEADVQVLRLGEDQETDGTMKLLGKLLRMVCCSERS